MNLSILRHFTALAVCAGLAACGGGDAGGSAEDADVFEGAAPSMGGVFFGALQSTTSDLRTTVVAMVGENGRMLMANPTEADPVYFGPITLNGTKVGGRYRAFTRFDSFENGKAITSGQFSGDVDGVGTLRGSFTAEGGGAGTFELTSLQSAYLRGSSLSSLKGNWVGGMNGISHGLTIADDGALTGDAGNGCSYTGAITLINPAFLPFNVTFVENCAGKITTLLGLGWYGEGGGGSPTTLVIGVATPERALFGQFVDPTSVPR